MEENGAQQRRDLFTISQEKTVLLFGAEEAEILPRVPGSNFTASRFHEVS